MLTVQLEIQSLLNKLWAEFDEIFRIAQQWYQEQLIEFLTLKVLVAAIDAQWEGMGM